MKGFRLLQSDGGGEARHSESGCHFMWPITQPFHRKKAEDYLSHFVGHEGHGSLLSALKSRGWASELTGGISEESTAYFLFDVMITLTETGLENVAECCKLVFAYLALLKERKAQRWVWDEMANIAAMKFRYVERPQWFLNLVEQRVWCTKGTLKHLCPYPESRFQEEEEVGHFVTTIAGDMARYTPEHTLKGGFIYDEFDEKLVSHGDE